jgi:hypothetical protein
MNTPSPYPDAEVPEISLPRFVLDRDGERGAAVPLMGPADPGTATPLMLPKPVMPRSDRKTDISPGPAADAIDWRAARTITEPPTPRTRHR